MEIFNKQFLRLQIHTKCDFLNACVPTEANRWPLPGSGHSLLLSLIPTPLAKAPFATLANSWIHYVQFHEQPDGL